MTVLLDILTQAVDRQVTDVFLVSGQPISFKIGKEICPADPHKLTAAETQTLITAAYSAAGRDMSRLLQGGDDDFALSYSGLGRMRVSAYRQRGSLAAVLRLVSIEIPDYRELGISEGVMAAAQAHKGLILVTGPAGHGKSTTLACILDRINHTRSGHIITLEDPIEYLYRNDRCIISQREVQIDTQDYITALRASLRQAPDIILLGEMRDYETIRTAMTAAETGHLVLSTLHTVGAANTVDRIIDIFPPNQQQQIRVQLAMLLGAVISQQLVPTVDGRVVPVFEIMWVNNAIRNLIREAKLHQIDAVIATAGSEGMVSMDNALIDLCQQGILTRETALQYAQRPEGMAKRLS